MKIRISAVGTLILLLVICAGCTQEPYSGTPTPTPPQTTLITPVSTPSPQPSFVLGDHYLKRSYSFQSTKDVFIEQVRVDNASWGIGFTILPLTDNITEGWFTMKVTNMNTGKSETFGYGRAYGYELDHLIPMYTTGPYEVEMRGYRVKVDVVLAKRNP